MEDYKVNSKTDILEFKRKHNKLVEDVNTVFNALAPILNILFYNAETDVLQCDSDLLITADLNVSGLINKFKSILIFDEYEDIEFNKDEIPLQIGIGTENDYQLYHLTFFGGELTYQLVSDDAIIFIYLNYDENTENYSYSYDEEYHHSGLYINEISLASNSTLRLVLNYKIDINDLLEEDLEGLFANCRVIKATYNGYPLLCMTGDSTRYTVHYFNSSDGNIHYDNIDLTNATIDYINY